jgi:hypothetical protein
VLILVADETIGDLLWRYVELASFVPAVPHLQERLAEAIERVQPSALLLDANLGVSVLPCERTAAAARIPIVYVASAMHDIELRSYARSRSAAWSPLSGGARALAITLQDVLAHADHAPATHAAMLAAAVVAHARARDERALVERETGRLLRAEREITMAMYRENARSIRDVLAGLARSLRTDGVSAERAITMMRGAVLNALDATGAARDARMSLEAAERCWREVFVG